MKFITVTRTEIEIDVVQRVETGLQILRLRLPLHLRFHGKCRLLAALVELAIVDFSFFAFLVFLDKSNTVPATAVRTLSVADR